MSPAYYSAQFLDTRVHIKSNKEKYNKRKPEYKKYQISFLQRSNQPNEVKTAEWLCRSFIKVGFSEAKLKNPSKHLGHLK